MNDKIEYTGITCTAFDNSRPNGGSSEMDISAWNIQALPLIQAFELARQKCSEGGFGSFELELGRPVPQVFRESGGEKYPVGGFISVLLIEKETAHLRESILQELSQAYALLPSQAYSKLDEFGDIFDDLLQKRVGDLCADGPEAFKELLWTIDDRCIDRMFANLANQFRNYASATPAQESERAALKDSYATLYYDVIEHTGRNKRQLSEDRRRLLTNVAKACGVGNAYALEEIRTAGIVASPWERMDFECAVERAAANYQLGPTSLRLQ